MIHAIVDRARKVQGADFIQLRNKNIDALDLLKITHWYIQQGHQVIVNTRTDIALLAGASGVHLPSHSLSPKTVRKIVPENFLIGVSCHSREELLRAEQEGASYAYLSPVFAPISKDDPAPVLGLDGFHRMIEGIHLPVYALGGITPERIPECLNAGAYGVAGISLVDLLQTPDPHRITVSGK